MWPAPWRYRRSRKPIQHSDAQPDQRLTAALAQANEQVYQRAHRGSGLPRDGDNAGGCTGRGQPERIIINVGDSRAYYLSQDGIRQITSDHSLVQDLLERGDITRERGQEPSPQKS